MDNIEVVIRMPRQESESLAMKAKELTIFLDDKWNIAYYPLFLYNILIPAVSYIRGRIFSQIACLGLWWSYPSLF